MVKIGRRGSLSGKPQCMHPGSHRLPDLADNPVHALAPALAELASRVWDKGNDYFQPTSFQVSNINAGTGAPNVIPGELRARFNIRFSTEQTVEKLQQTVAEILNRHKVNYTLEWFVSGLPFFTPPGDLSAAVERIVKANTGRKPELSTTGGTSEPFISRPRAGRARRDQCDHSQGERVRARRRLDALSKITQVMKALLPPDFCSSPAAPTP
jgi:succinyl-diaminopimelate desuccinylase